MGEPSRPPELGYTPPMPGDELGYWTIRVAGGGAFLANAALILHLEARDARAARAGGRATCFERLYKACEDALAAEDAKVGIHE